MASRQGVRSNERDRRRTPNDVSSNEATLDDTFDDELDDTVDDESFYDATADDFENTSGETTCPDDVNEIFVGLFEPDWVDDGQTAGDEALQADGAILNVLGNTTEKARSLWLDNQLVQDWEGDRDSQLANVGGDADVGPDVDDCVEPFCGFSDPLADGDYLGPVDRRDDGFFAGFGLVQDDAPCGGDNGDADMLRDDTFGFDVGTLPVDVPVAALSQISWKQADCVLHEEPVRALWVGQASVVAAGYGAVLLDATDCAVLALSQRVREIIPAYFHGPTFSNGAEQSAFVAAAALDERVPAHVLLATGHHVLEWQDGALCKIGTFVSDEPGDSVRRVIFNACGGVAYALTTRGALLVSANHGRVWKQMKGIGRAVALGVDDNRSPHVLVQTPDSLRWYHSDEAGHWESFSVMLSAPAQALCEGRNLCASICAYGDCRAIAFENGLLQLSKDAGKTWCFGRVSPDIRAVALMCDAAALCQDRQGDWLGQMLIGAVVNEFQNRSYLFGWSGGDEPQLLADLSAAAKQSAALASCRTDDKWRSNGDGMYDEHCLDVFDLVWDQWRGCLWVGASTGLSCWQPGSTS